ncbi:Y-family DNA polymerase [Sphingomonas qomolangmaensis]
MNKQASARRRYLALWFPFLPVDRLVRMGVPDCDVPDDSPFALVEKDRGAIRLVAVDPRAQALGLAAGLSLADARARVPELAVFDADPVADIGWLERLADGCERYTPMVALDSPDGLTLDITGAAHLFGDEAGLLADVEARMARWTGHLRHAFAGSPEGAQALARFQTAPAASEDAALRRLGVEALRLDDETETALRRAGLKTLGDLAVRPSGPVSARFGKDTTDMLARVLGSSDSRISPRRPPPAMLFERRFAEPIARTQDALAAIGDLAQQAATELEERHMGGRRFAVRLFRSDGRVFDLAVESGQPLRDAAMLVRLFGERVDSLADPIDPGFGFDMIRLAIPAIEPLAPTQLQLEGGTISEEAMAALVDRLSARLGRGRIRRFATRDTHIPEQGVLTLPAVDTGTPAAWDSPEPGEPPLRPLHLFDPPQPIEVMAEVPDGPPHRFRWRRTLHDITRFEGPERIASEWWRRADNGGLTRDYYRIEDSRGRRFWVFRHGLYGREAADPRWYVHGLFA